MTLSKGLNSLLLLCIACTLFASSAQAQESSSEEAMALYERGSEAFNRGEFIESAELLEQAYALEADPTLLYNIARAYESAGDLAQAREAYERYLAEAPPDAELRQRVERRVQIIRSQPRAPQPSPDVPMVPEAPRHREVNAAPWIIFGIGVATLGAGLAVGILGVDTANRVNAASMIDGIKLRDEARTYATAANVLYAVGGLACVVGGIWGIIDVVEVETDDGASARLRLGPSSLELSGTF